MIGCEAYHTKVVFLWVAWNLLAKSSHLRYAFNIRPNLLLKPHAYPETFYIRVLPERSIVWHISTERFSMTVTADIMLKCHLVNDTISDGIEKCYIPFLALSQSTNEQLRVGVGRWREHVGVKFMTSTTRSVS
jgi:hypothetical protein